jgi:tetratricopeptide (TPR) repeat protein
MSLSDAELSWLEEYSEFLGTVCSMAVSDPASVDSIVKSNKRRFGDTHNHVAATLALAGTAYLFVSQPPTIKQTFKDCRRVVDVAIDEWVHHSFHIAGLCGLTAIHLNGQEFQDASLFADKLDEQLNSFPEATDTLQWKTRLLLGESHFLQKEYDKAYDLFFAAAVTLNKLPKDDDAIAQLAYIQARIAITQYLRKEFEDAVKILESVLAMRDDLNLPNSPLFIACSNLIASLHQEMGAGDRVEIFLNHSLAATQDFYGMSDPLSTETVNYIANYYMNCNDWSRAFEYLQESIAYIDKRFDAEQAIWVLDSLITITSLLENYDLQERYVEFMAEVYSRELKGDFMSDRSLVEKGDQGAAFKRQEKYQEIVDTVKAGYDNDLHPQVKASIGAIDPRVWTGPILEACREYAFRLLDQKSEAKPLPVAQAVLEQRDSLIEEWTGLETPGELPWQKPVTEYISQNKYSEAIALVEAFKQHEEQASGSRSRALIPLLETLSNLFGVKAGKGASRAYAIYAKLINATP